MYTLQKLYVLCGLSECPAVIILQKIYGVEIYYELILSWSCFPTLKWGTCFAGIWTGSHVLGFLPVLASCCLTLKMPNTRISTRSPRASVSIIPSNRWSTMISASFWVRCGTWLRSGWRVRIWSWDLPDYWSWRKIEKDFWRSARGIKVLIQSQYTSLIHQVTLITWIVKKYLI